MQTNPQFWKDMELLIQGSSIIIDRPQNSAHPRYPDMIFPWTMDISKTQPQAMAAAWMCGWTLKTQKN